MEICPCGSSKAIDKCCGMYHENMNASTALLLMKSRYAAYVIGDVDYLVKTTHPHQQYGLNKSDIRQWSAENTWQGLQIIATKNVSDINSQVEFKASFLDKNNKPSVHHELSTFDKIEGVWYYSKGVINPIRLV